MTQKDVQALARGIAPFLKEQRGELLTRLVDAESRIAKLERQVAALEREIAAQAAREASTV